MPRPRRRFLTLTLMALVGYVGAQLWDIHRVGHLDRHRKADCAIVLGAAAWHDKPSPVLRERLNHAINLYQETKVEAIILTGGVGEGANYSESKVGFDYCLQNGIPAEDIEIEEESINTLDNLRQARDIMAAKNWKSALLVSDPWHLKRARKMAQDLGMTVYVSGTPSTRFQSTGAKSKFLFGEFVLYHTYLITGE